MILIMAFLIVVAFVEIVLFAFLLTKVLAGRMGSTVFEVIVVSFVATGAAWAVPFEGWLGLTLRVDWFEPWSVGFAIGCWAFMGVPAAIFWNGRSS